MASATNASVFLGMQILVNHLWLKNHALLVEDGLIKNIMPVNLLKNKPDVTLYEFPSDHYLIPGLIDLHIHGAKGFDVMDGSVDSIRGISETLAKEGVTGFLATTMTASDDQLVNVLKTTASCMQDKQGARILGVHLEGPFISNKKMGAQFAKEIKLPDAALISRWQKMANDVIKLVTLAPELPHANSLIKRLNEMGIIVSVGHTNASYAETLSAIRQGCTHATHLFNAMSGLHQREPGAVGALLLSDQVNAEIIVDGVHLHPAIVDLCLRLKGKNRLLLVTDAMRAKCLGDGDYDLGGQKVSVRSRVATLADGTLAGSTLTMPEAIKNMVHFTGCSPEDAIYMASFNPAKIIGRENRKGSIGVGKDADLVVTNAGFEVVMTMREGNSVYIKT